MKPLFVVLLFASLLILLAARFFQYHASRVPLPVGKQVRLTVQIKNEPKLTARSQVFTVTVSSGQRITITTQSYPRYHYGDRIIVRGVLQENKIGDSKNTIYTVKYPNIELNTERSTLTEVFIRLRRSISQLYQSTLPPASSALLMGIVFGSKEQLPESFTANLRQNGLLHIIAASGMNVSMVAGVLFFLFSKLLRRRSAIIWALTGVWLYATLAGLESSIVRATLMASIAFMAGFTGRQNTALVALGLTGYVMLFFNPTYLTDVGFQLSLAATLGIILIKPLLVFPLLAAKLPPSLTAIATLFREDIQTTVAAQLATLPILLATFGQYGLLSILVNALVLWMIPLLMILGSLGAVIGLIIVPLGKVFLLLTVPFLWYFEWVNTYFGKFHVSLAVPTFPVFWVVGYYLLLVSYVLFVSKKYASNKKKQTK